MISKIFSFVKDFYYYRNKTKTENDGRFCLKINDIKPMLFDRTSSTVFDRHYIYHPAWAARIIKKTKPKSHVDISSTLAFASIVSAFCPVDFYDYRPADLVLTGLNCGKANLLKLPFENNSIESMSCMHTVEHVGLGRYGDKLDPSGDIKAIKELKRVLTVGGNLLFVVPVGNQAVIQYNAHRIYTVDMIKEYFKGYKLIEFALIPENSKDGGLVVSKSVDICSRQKYACGCFWFKKIMK